MRRQLTYTQPCRYVLALTLFPILLANACLGAPLTLAVIGDYGINSAGEARVAAMIKSWRPAAILTTGDNNYPSGSALTRRLCTLQAARSAAPARNSRE